MPTHFIESPPAEDDRAAEQIRSAALRFWRSFAQSDNGAAAAALKFLSELRGGGEEELYSVALDSPESSSGKFVKVELPSTSPRNVQDAWGSDKLTCLYRVDPLIHCLSFDGDISKFQGGEFFVACASKRPDTLEAGACSVGTHSHEGRVRVVIDEPAFLVKVRASSAATKPKVLAGVLLHERDLPPMLQSSVFRDMLEGFKAPPRVWKVILDKYPGLIAMGHYLSVSSNSSGGGSRLSAVRSITGEQGGSQAKEVPDEVDLWGMDDAADLDDELDERMKSAFRGRSGAFADGLGLAGDDFNSVSSVNTGHWSEFSLTGINRSPPSVVRSLGAAQLDPNRWNQGWRAPVAKLDKQLRHTRAQVGQRFAESDKNLSRALGGLGQNLEDEFSKVLERDREVKALVDGTTRRVQLLEAEVERLSRRETIPGKPGLSVDTQLPRSQTPPPSFKWGSLSSTDQRQLINEVIEHLDLVRVSEAVGAQLGLSGVRTELESHGGRLTKVEQEFTTEHGVISKLQSQVDNLESGKNAASCERGGYVFGGVADVQALVQLTGPGKLATRCLDLHGLLTLAQDPYVTYEAGVQVHAAAIKANFGSVVESRIKVSFEIPYPELIVKMVENSTTASRGGAKWAPMFQSAELFEDDFRDGAHRRVLRGIESAYELTQKAIDQEFPLGIPGPNGGNNRKIHTILTDQNRRAYRQTVGFIECLLPFYRTLKGGTLSTEDSWDRVFVFVLEVLTSLQEQRVVSTDLSEEAAMIWGCFRATDMAEEYRQQKYVEHPKALSILALTSIEREGKTMAKLEERVDKKIADAGKGDKLTKLDTRIQQLENKFKNMIAKNPDLK
eukprot:scaffold77143_cov87-Cyclotella_meneghiniana.AAC.1